MRWLVFVFTALTGLGCVAGNINDELQRAVGKCADNRPATVLQMTALTSKINRLYSGEVNLVEAQLGKAKNQPVLYQQLIDAVADKSQALQARGLDECSAAIGAVKAELRELIARAQVISRLPVRQNFKMILLSDAELDRRSKENEAAQNAQAENQPQADTNVEPQAAAEQSFEVTDCAKQDDGISALETKLQSYPSGTSGTFLEVRFTSERDVLKSCDEYRKLLTVAIVKAEAVDKATVGIATAPTILK